MWGRVGGYRYRALGFKGALRTFFLRLAPLGRILSPSQQTLARCRGAARSQLALVSAGGHAVSDGFRVSARPVIRSRCRFGGRGWRVGERN